MRICETVTEDGIKPAAAKEKPGIDAATRDRLWPSAERAGRRHLWVKTIKSRQIQNGEDHAEKMSG